MADNFTNTFKKTDNIFKNETFEAEWQKLINSKVKLLMNNGPNQTYADVLDKIRANLDINKPIRGKIGTLFKGSGIGKIIVDACNNTGKICDKAAAIKFLKHFYLAQKNGNQIVWIYSPPKAYSKWIYSELSLSENSLIKKLEKESEVYSDDEKQIMCDALLLARKWSLDAVQKLNSPNNNTNDTVKTWFADKTTTNNELATITSTLATGFQKVANMTNSTQLIFSDDAPDRTSGFMGINCGWNDWAFVKRSEAMDVLYLQGAFIKAGNSGKLWMCALTIIHEITHRALATKDIKYDYAGIKPGLNFAPDKAIINADNWAYFATDLAGMLSNNDLLKVLK